MSPGWPFLAQSGAHSSEQLFDSVIYFSNLLRAARIVLYSVNPRHDLAGSLSGNEAFLLNTVLGAIQANGHMAQVPTVIGPDYYKSFPKGVSSARQVDPNDLALQVLASQSGGLVLQQSNDIQALLRKCTSDADALYTLSYQAETGNREDIFHRLSVHLAREGHELRTRTGLYIR